MTTSSDPIPVRFRVPPREFVSHKTFLPFLAAGVVKQLYNSRLVLVPDHSIDAYGYLLHPFNTQFCLKEYDNRTWDCLARFLAFAERGFGVFAQYEHLAFL